MFILLPLSDAGLPKDIEEKKEIIHKIYDRALSLGMCKEDIVVDGLVATVGANPKAALETLETIRYCKENGFATICGLSNISFAMPERSCSSLYRVRRWRQGAQRRERSGTGKKTGPAGKSGNNRQDRHCRQCRQSNDC